MVASLLAVPYYASQTLVGKLGNSVLTRPYSNSLSKVKVYSEGLINALGLRSLLKNSINSTRQAR